MPLELEGAKTVGDVLSLLSIPEEVELVMLLNGHHAKKESSLADGDALTFFPPVTGG